MAIRRRDARSSEKGGPLRHREQAPDRGRSAKAVPDDPIQLARGHSADPAESWWSPEDAQLSVGQDVSADEPEGRPIPTRRLLVAGVLIFVFTTVSIVFLPDIVAVLSPMGAMVAFAAIVAAAVVTAAPRRTEVGSTMDDAKPVSCGGPRPVGELSRRMADKKDGGCGPSCGC